MPDETRIKRAAALEEKKRRLEALKARRSVRSVDSTSTSTSAAAGTQTSTSTTSGGRALSAVSASKTGNLDEYIDGLLNSPPPMGAAGASFPSVVPSSNVSVDVVSGTAAGGASGCNDVPSKAAVGGTNDDGTSSASALASASTAQPPSLPVKAVETYTMGTQTIEDEFPEKVLTVTQLPDDDDITSKEEKKDSSSSSVSTQSTTAKLTKNAKILDPVQVSQTVTTPQFTSFFTSASKKVERLLGAPLLSDLLVSDSYYYTDAQTKLRSDDDGKNDDETDGNSLISAQVAFRYPRWTNGRDVTSLDWSPHHRGEVMLASYHRKQSINGTGPSSTSDATVESTSANNNAATTAESNISPMRSDTSTAISSLSPNPKPPSTLQPSSKSEMTSADGLVVVWNLTMPERPEHIFTCGSPVLVAKFHPTEGNLIIGGCESGQVVIWDVRCGRLPVQRSSLNLLGNAPSSVGGGGKNATPASGHVHPIVGMELLNDGSALVTASSDGKVNFWSLSNLRDPAESVMVPGGNLSSMAVAPETQSLLLGDESGVMFTIVSSSSAAASGGTRSARRVIRKLSQRVSGGGGEKGGGEQEKGGEEKDGGPLEDGSFHSHFGNVTGLSTKQSMSGNRNSMGGNSNASGGVSLAKGFVRGSTGFVLSCGVDWTTKLWAPAYTEKPLLNLLSHSYDYMCDVQWNPANPSIFATASSNGSLGLWNLASSLDEPMTGSEGVFLKNKIGDGNNTTTVVSRSGINKIEWSQDGKRIIAATQDTLHVLGISEDVWKVKGDEEMKMMSNLKSRGLLEKE